jgi:hypothetical protein
VTASETVHDRRRIDCARQRRRIQVPKWHLKLKPRAAARRLLVSKLGRCRRRDSDGAAAGPSPSRDSISGVQVRVTVAVDCLRTLS